MAIPAEVVVTRPTTTATGGGTILAAGVRSGFVIWNEAAVALLVKFGTGASLTSFTWSIPASSGWATPAGMDFQGPISAILASGADSTAQVTALG